MKKKLQKIFICLALGMSFCTVNQAFANSLEQINSTEESHVIAYPADYDTRSEGASAYNGLGNIKQSLYFAVQDFYNLQSTDSLTILPHYKTYQQTTEITCGPAAALTVLVHYGNTSWTEKEIAKIMDTKPAVGTDTAGMVKYFKKIGWDVTSSLNSADENGTSFASVKDFKEFVIANLKNNTPILVENIDWGGHWRVIIGYDTMGTETTADDVLILADPYDTSDHSQDGYNVNSVERFYFMWFDAHMLPEGQQNQQWIIAKPQSN
ncbi:C39 family peptidase [Anaerosinus massiliensis]|uniref:C39 family peptidase n=1 Tax=Massilibacillus massiliensis TaxID=1806837 RepID=UPI000AD233C1|nr:C39 family peptidase [Massilibacillus massiliensis]